MSELIRARDFLGWWEEVQRFCSLEGNQYPLLMPQSHTSGVDDSTALMPYGAVYDQARGTFYLTGVALSEIDEHATYYESASETVHEPANIRESLRAFGDAPRSASGSPLGLEQLADFVRTLEHDSSDVGDAPVRLIQARSIDMFRSGGMTHVAGSMRRRQRGKQYISRGCLGPLSVFTQTSAQEENERREDVSQALSSARVPAHPVVALTLGINIERLARGDDNRGLAPLVFYYGRDRRQIAV